MAPRRLCLSTSARTAAAVLAVLLVWPPPSWGGDPQAGRDKARQCRACHGIDGIARQPNVPHLAGESELYLSRQLRAFRSGERQDPQMSVIAKDLSDADIDDLAAWYAAIEISVELPDLADEEE